MNLLRLERVNFLFIGVILPSTWNFSSPHYALATTISCKHTVVFTWQELSLCVFTPLLTIIIYPQIWFLQQWNTHKKSRLTDTLWENNDNNLMYTQLIQDENFKDHIPQHPEIYTFTKVYLLKSRISTSLYNHSISFFTGGIR